MVTDARSLRAGFAETDITPPVGTRKIGVLTELVSESALDSLRARVAIIENAAERIAFVQLDTLCVRWSRVAEIRRRVTEDYGFPGANVMVGYTPTREAFERGGYETAFGPTSHLAPEAGDLLAESAIEFIRQLD